MADFAAANNAKERPTARLWFAVLCLHFGGAAGWWWIMPHGFPWLHVRNWANNLLPLLVGGVSVAGLYAIKNRRVDTAAVLMIAFPIGWTAALIAAAILFPISIRRCAAPLTGFVAVLWIVYFLGSPWRWLRWPNLTLTFALASVVGATAPWTQRSPEPATLPCNEKIPAEDLQPLVVEQPLVWLAADRVQVLANTGDVVASFTPLTIELSPLLTFESRSPDRCWTILAPPTLRQSSSLELVGKQEVVDGIVLLSYAGDARRLLRVDRTNMTRQECLIESFTQLDAPVYSHLNSFTKITVRGHQRLALGFSPCPGMRVVPEPTDYPAGRPTKFAYLASSGEFHVVEASSGEKGPFHEFGHGRLARTDQLTITLFDDDQQIASIDFFDWASQASVELSPTAGWGAAMNSIEFFRVGDAATAPVEIWISLAATSVGRGWDSVGHEAGIYRNRIRLLGFPGSE
jgi:hypothetical protein